MNIVTFLLFGIFPLSAAISPINLENCNPGSYFVENYIKYQCYQSGSVKGYNIAGGFWIRKLKRKKNKFLGCQPSNDLTGVTLQQWETHNEKWFKYHCVIDGTNAQYSVKSKSGDFCLLVMYPCLKFWLTGNLIHKTQLHNFAACLDPVGEVLPVGKTRSFPDGETFTCFIERNKVKLNHQTSEQYMIYHAIVPANYVIVRPNGDVEI